MGTDKATLVVGGRALVTVAADALREAGAADVFVVGGNADAMRRLGLDHVADRWPGEGPLGAIVTALEAASHDVVVVLACDMPGVTAEAVCEVVGALRQEDDAVVARTDGRAHPLLAVYRRRCLPTMTDGFTSGERAVNVVVSALTVTYVDLPVREWSRNVNFPHELG